MILSIIIPVYNGEKYISQCVNSCLMQNVPKSEYEIIVINDGSTDNTKNLLNEFSEKYENIVCINKSNEGVSVARNMGIDMATGKYLWFVDADDFVSENCFGYIFDVLNSGDYDRVRIGSYAFREILSEDELDSINKGELKSNVKIKNIYVTRSIFNRELLNKNSLRFDVDLAYGEDELFDYEMSLLEKYTTEIDSAFYFYRRNTESVMNINSEEKVHKLVSSKIKSIKIVSERYKKEAAPQKETVIFLVSYLDVSLKIFFKYLGKDSYREIKTIYKCSPFPFVKTKCFSARFVFLLNLYSLILRAIYSLTRLKSLYFLLKLWVRINELKIVKKLFNKLKG